MTGLVLLALGLAVLAESYAMPRLAERSINPWTVPGLVPGMLGIIIAVLGGALALRTVFAGTMKGADAVADAAEMRAGRIRFTLCLVLCLVYAIVLLGRLPFWLASGLFVFSFVAAFEWRSDDSGRTRGIKLAIAGALAAVAAIAIPFLFETLFLVRLP